MFKDRFRLLGAREHKTKKSNSTMAQVYAINTIKQCQMLKAIKAIKLTVAWSLCCHHVLHLYSLCGSEVPWRINQGLNLQCQGQGQH